MMKKLLVFSSFLFWAGMVWSQESTLRETLSETYEVSESTSIEINNKYGNIIVNSWQKDSVKILVEIEARGKDRTAVSKELDRADINIRKYGQKILAETRFKSSRSGFFGDLLDQASEASKSLTKNHKLKINYEIWIPNDLQVKLVNKFGDIYLPTMESSVDIDLSYGNLRGNSCSSTLMLVHSFGKHSFDFVSEGIIQLRKAESNIALADYLEYQSSTSEIELGKVKELKINSRNDKFDLKETFKVSGKGSFTDMNVEYLDLYAQLDFDYGEVFINEINKDFEAISLTGKSTDMNLILDQASYIDTEITGQEDRMILPNSMLLLNREQIVEENKIILKGYVGNTNTAHGNLKVNATNGDLIISIKETSVFTNKE